MSKPERRRARVRRPFFFGHAAITSQTTINAEHRSTQSSGLPAYVVSAFRRIVIPFVLQHKLDRAFVCHILMAEMWQQVRLVGRVTLMPEVSA
jgi:hypothetical protein